MSIKKLLGVFILSSLLLTLHAQDADSVKNNAKRQLEKIGITFNEESFIKQVAIGDTAVAKLFLRAGIRSNAKNNEGETALLIAAEHGDAKMVQLLASYDADVSEIVEALHQKSKKKDFWDKLSALSTLATVFASILIASIGWYFTQSYNRRQIEQNKRQSDRDASIKEQENRILEMETIEKMIPHLTKDENSKKVALIAIRSLARPELATQLAQLYPSEGSIQALQQFAQTGDRVEKGRAVNALSNIAVASTQENKTIAIDALDKIFTTYRPGVVKITSGGLDGTSAIGTGIIVNADGVILTAAHVLQLSGKKPGSGYLVSLSDNTRVNAVIMDIGETLALIRIDGNSYKPLRFAAGPPDNNTRVVAIGAIYGADIRPEIGTIRTVDETYVNVEFDKPGLMPGVSGGPVMNVLGDVVGISFMYQEPIRMCIRSDYARKYVKSKNIDLVE